MIIIHTAGYCHDVGHATQRSGISIILLYDDGYHEARRVISYPTGNITKNLADINAVKLGLASLQRSFRKSAKVTIVVPKSAINYFMKDESGEYEKNSPKYKEELDEVRKWMEYYDDLTVVVDDGSFKDCFEEAKICADNQKPKDTKTQLIKS